VLSAVQSTISYALNGLYLAVAGDCVLVYLTDIKINKLAEKKLTRLTNCCQLL
jgi:hypothetical protein